MKSLRPLFLLEDTFSSAPFLMKETYGPEIASNIASSAPISAIYTFTYESIKGSLLPFLPTEYQSFAHCMADGCASIATSFIFTPSERIMQQMQVGSHYHKTVKVDISALWNMWHHLGWSSREGQ